MLAAGVLSALHGKSIGHDAAWIIGSVIGAIVIGIVVVGLVRLVWVRGIHRASRVWTGAAVLAAGLASLVAAAANAARTTAPTHSRSVAASAASCLVGQQPPLLISPPGFDYVPLSAVQSEAVQQLNASVGSGGASGDFLSAKNLAQGGHVIALVIAAAGAGYKANQADFVHGLAVQDGANPGLVSQTVLPNGRKLFSFKRKPISAAITFSGCYALVVEAGNRSVARAVANLLP